MKPALAVVPLVLSALVPVTSAWPADAPTVVEGSFESQGVKVPIAGAYAFRTTSSAGSDAIINVVVSNGGIDADLARKLVDPWLDRRLFFEKRYENEETAVINFEFSPDGKFGGVSYQLGSGNGCGFCVSPAMKSTVKLAGGRLAGTLSCKEEGRAWEITLDVGVASDDHGAALPADGGEPAKAYLAYAAALKAGDAAALKKVIVASLAEQMAEAEKKGSIEGFLGFLGEDRWVDTVTVEKGFATPDTAVLVLKGEGPIGKRQGEVVMRREDGAWRVHDEILSAAIE